MVLGLAALVLAVLDPPRVAGRVDVLELVEAIALLLEFVEVDLVGNGNVVSRSLERIRLSNILAFWGLTFFIINNQLFLEEIDGLSGLGRHHSDLRIVEVHVHQSHHVHVHVERNVRLRHHIHGREMHAHVLPELMRIHGS